MTEPKRLQCFQQTLCRHSGKFWRCNKASLTTAAAEMFRRIDPAHARWSPGGDFCECLCTTFNQLGTFVVTDSQSWVQHAHKEPLSSKKWWQMVFLPKKEDCLESFQFHPVWHLRPKQLLVCSPLENERRRARYLRNSQSYQFSIPQRNSGN